jgi:signal peptidase I
MQPVLHTGDLVVLTRQPQYAIGQIAAYRSENGTIIMHRIVSTRDGSYRFKGDHEPAADTSAVSSDRIVGRALLNIPHGAVLVHPPWLPNLASVVTLMALLWLPVLLGRCGPPKAAMAAPLVIGARM